MSRDYFYSLLYCDRWKFNLAGGFLIFLFMVTGREIIFICSTFFIYWTRLKIAKPLATASELIRKNSVSYLKNQAIFSHSERTGLNPLLWKFGEVHTSAKWLFNYSWICFLTLKAVDKEFSLHKKTGLSTSIPETSENAYLLVISRLISSVVCIYIQYFFDVLRNKLQTTNIY